MPSEEITVLQQVVSGSVAALMELPLGHPLGIIKIRYQTKQPFTINPSTLYQGFGFSAASMVPITAIQTTSNQFFKNVLFANSPNKSSSQNVVCAYAAGAFASLVASPVEMVITNMTDKRKFVATARAILNQGGLSRLYTGFWMTVMRDGNFGVGYMALPGVLKPKLQTFTYDESYADVASKVVSGVVASVGSQVFDTVKTAYQKAEKGMRFFDVAKQPFDTHGVRGYFNGGAWRAGRIVPAVYILSTVTDRVNTFFNQANQATANNTSSTKNDRTSGFSK